MEEENEKTYAASPATMAIVALFLVLVVHRKFGGGCKPSDQGARNLDCTELDLEEENIMLKATATLVGQHKDFHASESSEETEQTTTQTDEQASS